MPAEIVEGAVLRPDGSFAPARLEIRDGVVVSREEGGSGGPLVAPGLVDLQVNGAAGVSVTDGPEALARIDAAMLDAGVTSWLATVMTDRRRDRRGGRRLGARRASRGAVPLACVPRHAPGRAPARACGRRAVVLRASVGAARDARARARPAAPELARALDARGVVVSLGHSDATYEQAAGVPARMVTHLFNAMRPPHHRRPSLLTWALLDESVAVGLIPDGVHVDPLVHARSSAGSRASASCSCRTQARRRPGRRPSTGCRASRSGASATSAATPRARSPAARSTSAEGVRRYVRFTGASLGEALVAATYRPAALAGIGSALEPGDAGRPRHARRGGQRDAA